MNNTIDLTPRNHEPLEAAPDFVKEIFQTLGKKVEDAQPLAIHHALTTCNSNQEKTGLALFGQQLEEDQGKPLECYGDIFEILHARDIDHAIVVVQRNASHPFANTLMSYPPIEGRYPIDMIADDILDFWMGDKT